MKTTLSLLISVLSINVYAQKFHLGNSHCETQFVCEQSRFEGDVCQEIENRLIKKGYIIKNRVDDDRYSASFTVSSNDEAGNWFSSFYARASIWDNQSGRYVFESNKKIGFFSSNDSAMEKLAKRFIEDHIENCR
jgi:hypothetical protein